MNKHNHRINQTEFSTQISEVKCNKNSQIFESAQTKNESSHKAHKLKMGPALHILKTH